LNLKKKIKQKRWLTWRPWRQSQESSYKSHAPGRMYFLSWANKVPQPFCSLILFVTNTNSFGWSKILVYLINSVDSFTPTPRKRNTLYKYLVPVRYDLVSEILPRSTKPNLNGSRRSWSVWSIKVEVRVVSCIPDLFSSLQSL
jgi:hypothetical protein